MGFSNDKIFRIILLAVIVLTAPAVHAATDNGVASTLTDYILPHYREIKGNQILQFVLYGSKAVNLGPTVTIQDPLIDLVSKILPDVEDITLLKGVKSPDPNVKSKDIVALDKKRVYPLHTDEQIINAFWRWVAYSDAVISSSNAVYDKNKRILTGEDRVYFRSRELDIDGIGFHADQERKIIIIKRQVQVVYRPYARANSAKLWQEIEKILFPYNVWKSWKARISPNTNSIKKK